MKQTAVEYLYKNYLENPISNQDVEYNEAVFHNAKQLEKQQMIEMFDKGFNEAEHYFDEDLKELANKINRVEVIQHSPPYNGRAYTNRNAKNVEIQLQDNNETLKIFLI